MKPLAQHALLRRAKSIAGRGIDALPEPLSVRLNPKKYGYHPRDVPPPPSAPDSDVRLFIAPVNFAGQGNAWARSVERLAGVGASSMHYTVPGDFGFPGDNIVPVEVFHHSRKWQRAQFERIATSFTHVLFEAVRPIFGTLFNGDPVAEAQALQSRGVGVGMVSHGSDLRLPSRHREIDRWSHFNDPGWELIPTLERQALANREILRKVNAPVFIATSDLALDWPEAKLLPIVVDPEKWRGGPAPLIREVPIVVHAPSKANVKGSALVDPIMEELAAEGRIEYLRIQGVPATEMPEIVRNADVVLEQFRVGNYATAAIEAMAAGRIVVGHLHDQVRAHVRDNTHREVPVVEATPDTLRNVVENILLQRDHYRAVAAEGAVFAAAVHDGRMSAQVLAEGFLGLDPGAALRSSQ